MTSTAFFLTIILFYHRRQSDLSCMMCWGQIHALYSKTLSSPSGAEKGVPGGLSIIFPGTKVRTVFSKVNHIAFSMCVMISFFQFWTFMGWILIVNSDLILILCWQFLPLSVNPKALSMKAKTLSTLALCPLSTAYKLHFTTAPFFPFATNVAIEAILDALCVLCKFHLQLNFRFPGGISTLLITC